MGVEVLALSVNIPTTNWERLSSSLQASTRGGIDLGTSEFKASKFACQVASITRSSPRTQGMTDQSRLNIKSPLERRIKKGSCCRLNSPKYDFNSRIHAQQAKLNLPFKIEKMGSLTQISCSLRTFIREEIPKEAGNVLLDQEKVGVLLLNLGGPETLQDVQPFLFNLFADPDIIRLPRLFRFLQKPLAQFISVLRAPKSKEGYAAIGGGSPLRRITDEQAAALEKALKEKQVAAKVYVGMRYWHPFTEEAIDQIKSDEITKLVVLPLYPQFSISTSGSSLRLLESIFREDEYLVRMQHTVIPSWYQRQGYIKAMTNLIEKELQKFEIPEKVMIFFSAHGVPLAYVEEAGDPYKLEMEECVDLIMKELKARGINSDHTLAYQSRVGPVEWLKPYTDDTIKLLGKQGVKSLLAVPISFVSEHIETLEEIDMEYKELALESGIENWERVPALGCEPTFISDLADAVIEALPYVGAMAVSNLEARQSLVPLGSVEELLATYDSQRRELPPPVTVWEWGWTKSAETWNGRAAMLAVLVLLYLEVTTGQGFLHQWGVLPLFH
uniref:Ferrochelatase n=1 Tax=Wollemia nobilis TaxID=56998 RepID=A0A0C9QL38_9CONI